MKRYIHILVMLFLAAGLLPACRNLLEENPKDQVFVENYFQTSNDAVAAVNSIYAILNSTSSPPTFGGVYHSSYWVVAGLASDDMENRQAGNPDLDQLETFTFKPVNSFLYDIWRNAYKGISNANFAIEGIPRVEMDEGLKNRLLGEAHFLRGMLYFDLVRLFGDIPLVLSLNAELTPARTPAAQVYDQILQDLQFAKQNLPASYSAGEGLGRATLGAANALAAKVHLTLGSWQECIDHCQAVISSGNYGLWEDFAEVFRLANENGKESVFNIGFGTANNTISFWEVGQFNVRLLPRELSGEIPGVNAQGWQVATQFLYDSYDPQDRRREVTLLTTIHNTDGSTTTVEPHIQKYWDRIGEPAAGNTDNDFPYLRYSDVLLMYAEALNELNNGPTAEAYQAINSVRKRARFNGTEELPILPDLSGLSYQGFKDALLQERQWEFVAEGQRWFDLVRFGRLEEQVPKAKPGVQPQPFHNLFPVPQEEIDLNPNLLPQNPGY
ncbi:MAG: RagB/SusD family nutrient uptake outer membrane protein [Lewinellaceae bacterium]|nr:RagB/SusD family nutrient uptake outer membrane protein [Lewinellaceae bacterium]MCB9285681.1 RagB/SusD family nutrient uptake outer membrane protein [Lewinellaceae bacterium]